MTRRPRLGPERLECRLVPAALTVLVPDGPAADLVPTLDLVDEAQITQVERLPDAPVAVLKLLQQLLVGLAFME